MSDVDERILWLAAVICMPTRRAAMRAAFDKIIELGNFRAVDRPKLPEGDNVPRGFAEWATRHDQHELALAFYLVAMSTDDAAEVIHSTVSGAIGLMCSADGNTGEARARLRVWDDVARGKYDRAAYGGDFFEIAAKHWNGEMRYIVATIQGAPMRDRFKHPALQTLMYSRWDDALGWLLGASADVAPRWRLDNVMASAIDRAYAQRMIRDLVDDLYARGTPAGGALALAWLLLTADPRKPESFNFLPQLQSEIDHADLEADDYAAVRERIRIWWRAAEAEWTDSEVSIFRITEVEAQRDPDIDDQDIEPRPPLTRDEPAPSIGADPRRSGPTLVVMPGTKATKLNNFHTQYKDIVDAPLPLVVVNEVARIRATLHAEFPHAVPAVDLMMRDLREGRPVTLKPVLLVGSPGCGKSRLVRRLADVLGAFVYRYDAASSSDSQFGGTGKAWSNTEPSVPARAIAQSKTASPIVMVDEIDKAAERNWNGRLWDAMVPFLERETASRYRDQSLDCELDLSMISYIATANDVSKLPAPLRDRFRIVKVPTPTLAHLPKLAANVMRDLAIDDEARQHDAPLATDELDVIGKAWARSRFSMRTLQKIVSATLEARDSYAMRH